VSAAAFDNTMLSVLLNPSGNVPCIPGTTTPIDLAKERAEGVIDAIQRDNRKIILPTPALAELLTAIGPDAQQYLDIVAKSRVFEIAAFDARAAIELAFLNRGAFRKADDANNAEPYQKRKVDRQIVAICVVTGASEIYTDDGGLAASARLCGITPISLNDCPIPTEARQRDMFLQQHDALPDAETDGDEASTAE
jgi:predicted nucleic acid-binding protein